MVQYSLFNLQNLFFKSAGWVSDPKLQLLIFFPHFFNNFCRRLAIYAKTKIFNMKLSILFIKLFIESPSLTIGCSLSVIKYSNVGKSWIFFLICTLPSSQHTNTPGLSYVSFPYARKKAGCFLHNFWMWFNQLLTVKVWLDLLTQSFTALKLFKAFPCCHDYLFVCFVCTIFIRDQFSFCYGATCETLPNLFLFLDSDYKMKFTSN